MLQRLAIGITLLAAIALLVMRAPAGTHRTDALGAFGRGPAVVLVHGLGSSSEHWMPVARDLARDHRVVLVDLPGHGLGALPHPLTLEAAVRALDRAIAAECDQPVVLVGHSVGGLVAAAEAIEAPGRVRALVLVETALRPQMDAGARAGLMAALDRDYRATLRENYTGFGRDSAQGVALFEEALQLAPETMKTWIRIAVSSDLSRRAAALRAPTLVVLSERSWPPGEDWRSCADTLGYGAVRALTPVRVPSAGHFVMIDQPTALADLIRRFERGYTPPTLAALAR